MKKVDVEVLQATYRELYELVGEENMLKIFNYYHGLQLNFPVHLYGRVLVARKLVSEKSDDYHLLARRYGFSERWVKRNVRKSIGEKDT
ncbi:hypothetical protein ADT67_12475 [Levilactobacillus brevis]|uniref:Uncharacterized protein n=1 Tax=Levilactobacillus brevis TaxID=1580 RepID=A0A5B7XWQ3_LEVBR|nr:hypothetical protein [Levilactobacillus brevis]AJA80672.1 hypothetical protein L747_01565 [Levilactobacillus brevis BSO 464]KIO94304.1 hypothetical protein N624_0418 [Levilactobacillus brevis]OLF66252.1 hypothetical protein ADT67_12475 [Levilactobacillus brevis]QCZ52048.1 hypothetical protein UCCLBBS449_0046 [Levilactobacillus brevis]